MSVPQISLAAMADAIRKSDDQLARYIAGEAEMGFVAWLAANEAWPELKEIIEETEADRRARSNQRTLDLGGGK